MIGEWIVPVCGNSYKKLWRSGVDLEMSFDSRNGNRASIMCFFSIQRLFLELAFDIVGKHKVSNLLGVF